MKQRILLMTLAIAFLFTGLASATCYLNDVQDDKSEYEGYLNVSLVINNTTTPYTAEMELTNDTMLFFPNAEISTVLLNVPADQIASATDSNGNELNVTASNDASPFDIFSTAISGEQNILTPITITFEDAWDGTFPENAGGYPTAVEIQNIGENDADSAWVSLGFCEEEMAGNVTAGNMTNETTANETVANETMNNISQENMTNGATVVSGDIVETNAVSVSDSGISPANIRVAVDDGVTWTNDGDESFTISEFDSGSVVPDSMYSRLFRSSGVYEYTVEIGGESYQGTVTVGNGETVTETTTENVTDTTNVSDMNASTNVSENMTEGNVTEDNVTDVNVTEGNVTDVNVTEDNVTDANVTDVNVTEDNVTDANVTDVNVTEDNVTDANVTDVNVTEGNLTRCYLNVVEDNKSQYDGQLNATLMVDTQNSMAQLDLTNDTKEMFPNSTVKTILLNVPADQIMNANDSLGNEWVIVDIQEMENPFGFFLTKITTDEAENKPFGDFMTMITVNDSTENATGPATIYFNDTWNGTLPENEDGYVIATDVQNIGEAGNDSAWITLGFCEAAEGGTMPPADGGVAMDNVTCYLNTVEDSKSEYDGMLNASLMVNNETAPYSAEIEIMNETMAEFPNATINTILLNVPGDMIENVTDSHGSWTILDQGAGTVLMMITSNQTEPANGPVTIYFNDTWNGTLPTNDAGYKIAVDFRNIGEMEDDSAWVTCGNETMAGNGNMTNESEQDTTSGAMVANGEIVETNAVSVSDSGISPANIRVAVDDGVTWANDGNESFTISEFDSGSVAPDSMYSRLFRSSGVYEYTVEIGGESYQGTITVGDGGTVAEEEPAEEETTDEETVDDAEEDMTEEDMTDEETVDDTEEDMTEEETTDEETVDDTEEDTTEEDSEENMT
ncbi:MAG: hypothetical protein SCH66_07230 [Methanolobus sp.]|nr:hypothetical protein [Methanolobus sp.]